MKANSSPHRVEEMVDAIHDWAWDTAVPGETSTETFKRGIERALSESPETITVMREALESLCRKYAAAWAALSFAHDEGFEWPVDPLGEEAIAFADPTVVPEYKALAALSNLSPLIGDAE